MGRKSGSGQAAPYEAPNSLSSAQSLRIIDAISEGVISGFANGDDAPFKSVFFDDTPVQNPDGSFNYKGVVGFFQRGLADQSYVPGFDASERTIAVSAGVKNGVPIVRAVSDGLVSRLRVTVAVERNSAVNDNGDTHAANTSLLVELVNRDGVRASQQVAFTEKSSGLYYQDVQFDTLPAVPFNIRVTRVTPDSTSDKVNNNTYFASYVEIIDAKLSYPHTAFAALAIDSDQFGNSVPRRNYLLKGRLVKVPSNYNPETRTYSGTTWDGSFKQAWTNNPAWVFYDVLTQPRFSTLARRLKADDVDKWSLYQIAKYCDEPVDDGFGGKEPRFVCNAYISDLRQAGEFLQDLAGVFTGLPVWNGQQMSVVMDADTDPVALYNNSNVKDGLFTYSGAAYKSIHTGVHVQYVDKYDGYRAKTEYVADDDAIARYGLNIKQITAFGCDSRGQAARLGAWVLQTELRQQNTVSFDVGREGLRHLPYDIVQVMDNQYAGAEFSGRVASVDGTTVTLDREVADAAGAVFYYSNSAGLQSAKVLRQPAENQVVLDSAQGLEVMTGWAVSGKVKPRLYRAVGIKENTEEGTYTITGLLHDPKKYAAVDTWANFDRELATLHSIAPVLVNGSVATDAGAVVISWDNLTAGGQVLTYDIKIYRNNQLYRHTPDAQTAEIRLENLPNGDYRAEIRGRNARGVLSEPLVKAWSVDYKVTGLRTTPKTFAVGIDWVLPQTVVSELFSELWYSRSSDFQTATKLASLPYPQNSYHLTGVGIADTFYFWVRVVDIAGNSGEFTAAVAGQADKDPDPIVQQVQGAITESSLSRSLINSLNSDMAAAARAAGEEAKAAAAADASAKAAAEAAARAAALQSEAAARQRALQAEATARAAAVKAAADKAAQDLTAKAAEIGTRIASVENVNATQAQQISTVTAAQGQTAAALEAEKKARADGDKAEAAARATLAARVATAEGNITKETQARVAADNAQASETEAVKTRVGAAEGHITALQKSVSDEAAARAEQVNTLSARFNNLAVGGRNLITGSGVSRRHGYLRVYPITEAPSVGETVTVTVWGELGETRNGQIGVYNSAGFNELFKLVKVSDGVYQGKGKWAHHTAPDGRPQDTLLALYAYPGSDTAVNNRFDKVKLERGNIGTDWTPAPEDLEMANTATAAELTAFKEAQATKDGAQTAEINAAKSAAANNAAEINALKTTKADSRQVVSLARTGLQSEWQRAATAAQTAAVQAAAADATAKTNAAKAAADTAAQEKADAAKAAAIADAAAKDAVIKQQAATDAQAKADAAKTAAIAEAQRLNTATDAKVTNLQKTVADETKARADQVNTLSARFDNLAIGGRNLLLGTGTARTTGANNTHSYTGYSFTTAVEVGAEYTFSGRLSFAGNMPNVVSVLPYRNGTDREPNPFTVTLNADGSFKGTYTATKAFADGGSLLVYAGQSGATRFGVAEVSNLKLEKGNVATDWTPAPEDTEAKISAEISTYSNAQAARDKVQTDEINRHKSRLDSAEAEISTLKTVSVTRSQVESIAESKVNAKFRKPDTRNDNQLPSWYWSNYPRQNASEFKLASVMGLGTSGYVAVETVVPWGDSTGGAITQTAYLQNGTVMRRKSNGESSWTAWVADETVAGAQAKADAVKKIADAANALATKADADFRSFMRTYANDKSAQAEKTDTLTAKVENMAVGGRNLLKNSDTAYSSANYSTRYALAEAPEVGEDVVVTLWGSAGADRTGIGVYNSAGYVEIARLVKVSDGVYQGKGKWAKPVNGGKEVTPNNTHLNVYFYPSAAQSVNTISQIKLERGTVGTDWTPAPEDVAATVTQTAQAAASLNGKVQSMYTLKTEAVTGGRRVIAGLALGADGQTGDSQMLVYANKFAMVDPAGKSVKTPFVVVTENGQTKMALDGDMIATGAVLAKHIAAGQTIQTPTLNSATINAGTIVGSTIRGAKIEAVDLEAANIIGDVVAVRSFSFQQSHNGYQELVCNIPESRKTKRTLIVPQVTAIAEDGAAVDLQLWVSGVLVARKFIQSPTKVINHSSSHRYDTWTPRQITKAYVGNSTVDVTVPSVHIFGDVPVSFSLPYTLPKTGGVAHTRQIDGRSYTVHILCQVNGSFNYDPLGDVSGIVCFIV